LSVAVPGTQAMVLDVRVRVVSEDSPPDPIFALTDARLKLHMGFLFLNGTKMKPLRSLSSSSSIDDVNVRLGWPGGPSLLISLPDSASRDEVATAAHSARAKALKSEANGDTADPVTPNGAKRRLETPKVDSVQKSCRRLEYSAVPRRTDAAATAKLGLGEDVDEPLMLSARSRRTEASGTLRGDEDLPPAPQLDATLTDEDRRARREAAAASATVRAEEVRCRGIGDVAVADRLRERAEREELVGRVQAWHLMRGRDVPLNMFGASVAELRAHVKSLGVGGA